jgi:hypothetical protein
MNYQSAFALAGALGLALAGCGGGGGGGPVSPPQPAPTVTVSGATGTVTPGAALSVTWSSTNATACTASGEWSGSKSTSGTEQVSGLAQSGPLTLTCTGPGGSATASFQVTVNAAAPLPTISFTATSMSIALAGMDTLKWSTTSATACTASDGWAGEFAPSGSQQVGPITTASKFTLTCDGPGGSVSTTVNVTVSSSLPPAGPVATIAPNVLVLDVASAASLKSATATALTFDGVIGLSVGQVFLLGGSVYKVSAVTVTAGQTIVNVSVPNIDEVFSKVDLTGTFTLDASQVVAQTGRTKAASLKTMVLSRLSRPDAIATVTIPIAVSAPPLQISGSASVSLTVTPDIHYATATGFTNSSISFIPSAKATAAATIGSKSTTSIWLNVATYQIPIPLTVVDGFSNLLGISAAAISLPINVGGDISTSLGTGISASVSGSSALTLSISSDGTLTGSTGAGNAANSLVFDTPTFSPSAETPSLLNLGVSIFAGVELKPVLVLFNTVKVLGVDTKIGYLESETVRLDPSISPPYCGSSSGKAQFKADGFFVGIGGTEYTWPNPPLTRDLLALPATPIGASCKPQPVATATPGPSPVLYSALPVSVALSNAAAGLPAGSPMPTGQVQMTLDGDSCLAAIDTTGAGSCSVTPSVIGDRILTFQYRGDSIYEAGAITSIPIAIAKANSHTTLLSDSQSVNTAGPVTFRSTVSASPLTDLGPLPTGTAVVSNGSGSPVCTISFEASTSSSCSYNFAAAATQSFSAVYSGDENYSPSTSNSISITVVPPVILKLVPTTASIDIGASTILAVSATQNNRSIPVPSGLVWSSSNDSIATVVAGTVTGRAVGNAIINVTDPASSATDTATVTVGNAAPDLVVYEFVNPQSQVGNGIDILTPIPVVITGSTTTSSCTSDIFGHTNCVGPTTSAFTDAPGAQRGASAGVSGTVIGAGGLYDPRICSIGTKWIARPAYTWQVIENDGLAPGYTGPGYIRQRGGTVSLDSSGQLTITYQQHDTDDRTYTDANSSQTTKTDQLFNSTYINNLNTGNGSYNESTTDHTRFDSSINIAGIAPSYSQSDTTDSGSGAWPGGTPLTDVYLHVVRTVPSTDPVPPECTSP